MTENPCGICGDELLPSEITLCRDCEISAFIDDDSAWEEFDPPVKEPR